MQKTVHHEQGADTAPEHFTRARSRPSIYRAWPRARLGVRADNAREASDRLPVWRGTDHLSVDNGPLPRPLPCPVAKPVAIAPREHSPRPRSRDPASHYRASDHAPEPLPRAWAHTRGRRHGGNVGQGYVEYTPRIFSPKSPSPSRKAPQPPPAPHHLSATCA